MPYSIRTPPLPWDASKASTLDGAAQLSRSDPSSKQRAPKGVNTAALEPERRSRIAGSLRPPDIRMAYIRRRRPGGTPESHAWTVRHGGTGPRRIMGPPRPQGILQGDHTGYKARVDVTGRTRRSRGAKKGPWPTATGRSRLITTGNRVNRSAQRTRSSRFQADQTRFPSCFRRS